MWFLILEVLILLTAATLFGAWLAWWWLSRQPDEESVVSIDYATRPDIDAGFARVSNAVAGIERTDLSPVESRLGAIEGRLSGLNSPVEERLKALETRLANREPDADRLNTRLVEIESKLSDISSTTTGLQNTDVKHLESQIDNLEAAVKAVQLPEIELGPIHSGLTRLEMALDNMEKADKDAPDFSEEFKTLRTDIAAIETRLAMVQQAQADNRDAEAKRLDTKFNDLGSRIGNLPLPDEAALQERLVAIEAALANLDIPEPDMRSLDEGLSIIHGRLASFETSLAETRQDDAENGLVQQRLDQVQYELGRLERMEAALGSLRMELRQSSPDLEVIEQRLAILQSDLDKQGQQDLTPVINSVYAMERRMDLGSLENRLTSIEYGLAALHHSLRTRLEDSDSAPAPRPPEAPAHAKTAPPAYMSPPPLPERDASYRPAPTPPPAYTAPPPRETWPENLPTPPAFEGREIRYEPRTYERPAPRTDALSEARRPDDKANLLTRPAFGGPDPLEEISGVGPMLHGLLNDIGVYYFWQIAEWGPEEVAWVDSLLDGFNGRIERDNWVGQAGIMASKSNTANRP